MKKQLLTLCCFGMLIGALQAASPKEMIREFVESQEKSVTAYEIAAHFDALMTDPVYGTASVFNTPYTHNISVAALDATHFIVTYAYSGGFGTAIIGEVNGTTISSYGTASVFNSGYTVATSVVALDATHFVVAYRDESNSNSGTTVIGEFSGTNISSYGAENVFNFGYTFELSIAKLDPTHFIVAYQDFGNSSHGTVIIGEISGGTNNSSYGAENVFNPSNTTAISVAAIEDATHFLITYVDIGNSYNGTAIIGERDGTSILSYGAESVFNAGTAINTSVAVLDATHFVVAYGDYGNNSYGTAIIGEFSGTSISSYGDKNVFNAEGSSYFSVVVLDASSFAVAYYSGVYTSTGPGMSSCTSGPCTHNSIIGDVSGTTISAYGNQVEIDNSSGQPSPGYLSAANIGFFVTVFHDFGTNQGTAVAASSSALPVEMVSFRAIKEEAGVKLLWQTASETNNKGFYIQRSTNANEWETLGFVEGDGYAVTLNDYQFMDTDPMSGLNYYRLRQVDFDDKFEYTDIVAVNNAQDINVQTFLYPNPTTDRFTFSINNPFELPLTIRLTDQLGRTIWESGRISRTISWEKEIQLENQGIYIMTTQVGDQLLHERIVVLEEK